MDLASSERMATPPVTMLPPASEDPTLVASYIAHRGGPLGCAGVLSLCFRPYMKHLVSGGADGTILMWGLLSCHESRRQMRRPYRLVGHKGPVCALAVSPLDTVIASGSKDKTVRLWLPKVDAKPAVIKGHSGTVRTVAFSPDGLYLLSGSDDKSIKVWDVETEKFVFALVGHLNWVRSAEFNRDGRVIVSGSDDKTIRLWDVERRECIHQYNDILGMVSSARFHPEGTCIASCGTDECIQIWDIRSKALVQHYAADAGIVNSVSFHPSGNFLLTTCDDGALRVWDLREGQLLYMLKGHEGPSTSAEFSRSGNFFASGSSDEQVIIWRSNFADFAGLAPGVLATALQSRNDSLPSSVNQSPKFSEERSEPRSAKPFSSKKQEIILENDTIPIEAPSKGPVEELDAVKSGLTDKNLPPKELEVFGKTLQHIVHQLDCLMRTVSVFEERLSHTETKVMRIDKQSSVDRDSNSMRLT